MTTRVEEYCDERGWTVLHRFVIARVGWEMDNDAVVARDPSGDLRVVSTNHGGIRVDEKGLPELAAYRAELAQWSKDLETAMELLMEETGS